MKRHKFLKLCFAAGATLAIPLNAISRLTLGRLKKGIHVKAGKDRFDKPISLFGGDTFYTKISPGDTDGDIYVYESSRLKEGGPALHVHYEQDEFWYILEGTFLFKVGAETFTAKAGDTVFGPRNIPHAFSKTGEGAAKLLIFFQPAGKMEEFFQKISSGATKDLTKEQQDKLHESYGFKVLGPALGIEKKGAD